MDQAWKTDLYKFVGKSFDFAYANRLNKLLAIMGEENSSSVDFELTGTGGYGELREEVKAHPENFAFTNM